jgi:hypothetical protein
MFRYAVVVMQIRTTAEIPQKIKPPPPAIAPVERRVMEDGIALARFVLIVVTIVLVCYQIRHYRNGKE